MYLPKVLIADPEEHYSRGIALALGEGFRTEICTDGPGTLERTVRWEPDVLIMELVLPGLDGVDLLRQLRRLGLSPRVLVVTVLASEFVCFALEDLNVSYAMLKPCSVHAVAGHARELLTCTGGRSPAQEELVSILAELGFSSGRQGYQDLLVGIPLLARQRNQRLGKELYDAIARENGSTAGAVEKAIRDVVRAAWEKNRGGLWDRLFPGASQYPTNKDFLFRMADLISARRKCG